MAVEYYKKRTDDDLRRLAEQQYQSYYDQLRLAARQKQEREATALEGQRAGITRNYQRQREESAKQYRQAYSQVDRETLRRGMQRSSYAAQRLANVNQEGLEADQRILEAQGDAEGSLDAQIAQLSGQLADTLAGYDANQAADVLKRYNELESEEYDRGREAEQYAESIRQWQAQFDENVRQFNKLHPGSSGGGGGGGGGSSRSSRGSNNKKTNLPPGTDEAVNDSNQNKLLSGSTIKPSGIASGNSPMGNAYAMAQALGARTPSLVPSAPGARTSSSTLSGSGIQGPVNPALLKKKTTK